MVEDYPKVSFLIPIFNEEKTLAQSLDSLLALEYPSEKMEILHAIGNCTDNTRMIADEYTKKYSNIQIHENPTGNTSIGRNICIQHATGEILMNYSGHVIAEKNLLRELAVKLQNLPADVVAVGCSNLSPGKQNFVGEVSGAAFLSLMGGRSSFLKMQYFQMNDTRIICRFPVTEKRR